MSVTTKTSSTPPEKIIAGIALLAAGYAPKRLARFLNVNPWRVKQIQSIKAEAERELELNKTLGELVKARLASAYRTVAADALVQAHEQLPAASALQAMTISGIATDKSVVLGGKNGGQAINMGLSLSLHVTKELDAIDTQLAALVTVPAAPADDAE